MSKNYSFSPEELMELLAEANAELMEDAVKTAAPQEPAKATEPVQAQQPAPQVEQPVRQSQPAPAAQEKAAAPIQLTQAADGQFSLFDLGEAILVEEPAPAVQEKTEATQPTAAPAEKKSGSSAKATKKAAVKAALTAATAGVASKIAKLDPKTFKVEADWNIFNSLQTFPVASLFEEELDNGTFPADGVTLEQVRERLSEEYYEFTEARTRWDVDKATKRAYVDVYGTAKG